MSCWMTLPGAGSATGGTLTCRHLGDAHGFRQRVLLLDRTRWLHQLRRNPVVATAGTYTLTVTGANGCTSQASADVLLDVDARRFGYWRY